MGPDRLKSLLMIGAARSASTRTWTDDILPLKQKVDLRCEVPIRMYVIEDESEWMILQLREPFMSSQSCF